MRLEANKLKRTEIPEQPTLSKLACAVSAAVLMLGVAGHKAEAATLRVDNNGDSGAGCTLFVIPLKNDKSIVVPS